MMKCFEVIANGVRLDMFSSVELSNTAFWRNLLAHYDLDNVSELIVRAVSQETYDKFASDEDADGQSDDEPVKYPSVPLY